MEYSTNITQFYLKLHQIFIKFSENGTKLLLKVENS